MLLLTLKDLCHKAAANKNAAYAQIPPQCPDTHIHTHTRVLSQPFFSVTVSDAWHILTPEADQCRYVQGEIEIHRKLGAASDLLE